MSSPSVVAPELPVPDDDALVRRLTAEVAELEALSRFTVEGIADRAERVAAEAAGPELTEVRLRARLVGADMARCRGEHAEAGRSAQAISRWAVENERSFLRARSAYVLAAIFQELGDAATALEHAVEAVDLLDDDAAAELRIDHSLRLADTLGQHGDASASLRYADVLALTHERGDARRELVVLNNWAYIETLLGRFEEALPIAQQLEARSADLGEALGVGRLDTLARVLIGLGRLEDAEAVLLPGLSPEALDSSTDGDAGADFLLTLAEVRRRLGHLDGARQVLDDCVARCDRHGLTAIRVRARQEQAELHAAEGDHRAAYTEHKLFHEQLMELQSAQRDARARAVQAMYETSEARRQSRRYRELSLRDPLTGLYNRRHIDEQLTRLLGPGSLPSAPLSIALVDLDHFKRINDTFGHDVGDAVLRRVADLLQAAVPADGARALGGSFAARMGGEEFLLVLVDTSPERAAALAEDLRSAIAGSAWEDVAGHLPVTASIGVTGITGSVESPAGLLGRADALLYRAKEQGRDRVVSDGE